MTLRFNSLVVGGCMGLLLASCGVTKTKERGGKFTQNDSNLAESWQSDCVQSDALGLTHSIKDYTFSGIGDFDRRETFFKDDSCQDKAFTFQVTGTYQSLGEQEQDRSLKRLNYTVSRVFVTPHSDGGVEFLNKASACGISDWAVDKEREVGGHECLGMTMQKGDSIQDIYQIVNDNTLYLGNNSFLGKSLQLNARPDEVKRDWPLREKD